MTISLCRLFSIIFFILELKLDFNTYGAEWQDKKCPLSRNEVLEDLYKINSLSHDLNLIKTISLAVVYKILLR